MKVEIRKANLGRESSDIEASREWISELEEYGFKLTPHSLNEEKGMTIRTNPPFNDFDNIRDNLVDEPEIIMIGEYNLDNFSEYQQVFYSQFVWDYEKDERDPRGYPKYRFIDRNERTIAFFDPISKDIYIHDFSHEPPDETTLKMLHALFSYIREKFGIQGNKTEEKEKELDVKYGADPEFLFYSPIKGVLNAERVISEALPNSDHREIGWDGHNRTGEIRPTPSSSPEELVDKMRKLFATLDEVVRERGVEIICGGGKGYGEPLGCHMHFSGISPSSSLIKAIDRLVSEPLLRMSSSDRGDDDYGMLGDVRGDKPHGGWEYRTPPSFISFPSIVLGAFKICQIIIEESYRGKDIPDNFIPKEIISMGRTKEERSILKRYISFIKYADLNSCPLQNWLEKEHLLLSKIVIHDKTGEFNKKGLMQIKKAVVGRTKGRIKSRRKKFFFTFSKVTSGSNVLSPKDTFQENVDQIVRIINQ